MKVVQRQNVETLARSVDQTPQNSRSMPPPSLPLRSQQGEELEYTQGQPAFSQPPAEDPLLSQRPAEESLFLPASQLSIADQEVLQSTGLGIENMTAEELAEMMDGDDEDLEEMPETQRDGVNDYQLFDDTEMAPTQNGLEDSRVRSLVFIHNSTLTVTSSHSSLYSKINLKQIMCLVSFFILSARGKLMSL